MTKASDNVFPRLLVSEGGSTATPAAGNVTVYAKADGLLYSKDDAGAETALGGGSGSVATDAIWDAAGDLAVGSGADTAARLALGNVGGVLARVNGAVAWNAGTSFPASKATGDRYWRSDLGAEYYWDGTRWLSVQEYVLGFAPRGVPGVSGWTVTATVGNAPTRSVDMYLTTFRAACYVGTTNDGSKYWTLDLSSRDIDNANTAIASLSTASNTPSKWIIESTAINAVISVSTAIAFNMAATEVSTPGDFIVAWEVLYRLIAT